MTRTAHSSAQMVGEVWGMHAGDPGTLGTMLCTRSADHALKESEDA